MVASGSRVGLRWCDSEVECLLEIWADDSIQSQLDTTLGDDVFIVLRHDDVCMKEQSCPRASGGIGEGGNRAESSCSKEQANLASVSVPLDVGAMSDSCFSARSGSVPMFPALYK